MEEKIVENKNLNKEKDDGITIRDNVVVEKIEQEDEET